MNSKAKEYYKRKSKERLNKVKKLRKELSAKDWEECLQFFNYKDAYTGMELHQITQDHVVPVEHNGDYIRENIVPCNKETNSSKHCHNMMEWYKKQPFFDKNRLNKIIEWMGEYSKYLYETKEESYTSPPDQGSTQRFTIIQPNGTKKQLFYSSRASFERRSMILYLNLLKKWEDYCRTKWIWKRKFDPFKFNHEDKVKYFLDRCSDFLLYKNTGEHLPSLEKQENMDKFEVPLSSSGHNVGDFLYSSNDAAIDNDKYKYVKISTVDTLNVDISNEEEVLKNPTINKWDVKRIKKNNFKNTNAYKINKLYTKEDKYINKKVILKNRDVFDSLPSNISEEDAQKWMNKNLRNYYGENVVDYKKTKIKGYKGIIDKDTKYISSWVYVDTENKFSFNEKSFLIDSKLPQYVVKEDNQCEMEKVLCYYLQERDEYRFFDENINDISKFIT